MSAVDADVLVVGGGPVGLACALQASRAGLRAVVLEARGSAVQDKACGEGLMPGAVEALASLGVDPPGRPFHGIAYVGPGRRVEHRFSRGPGRGVRRPALHAALAAAADAAGVEVVRRRVDAVDQGDGWVAAGGLRGRWLLAADGLHSVVRRSVGLEPPPRQGPPGQGRRARRYGLRRHYRRAPWSDCVEVHWAPTAEAYVTPVDDGLVGVAVLGPRGSEPASVLAALPGLRERLEGAEPDGPVLGAGPLRQRSTARVAGRVLLVGDASGYVDALTGEGLRVGLAQATAAVAAVAAGRPESYERAWRAATRDYRLLTTALLTAATTPRLRPVVVPAAVALPPVFGLAVERLAR